jgi:hypothetical protein
MNSYLWGETDPLNSHFGLAGSIRALTIGLNLNHVFFPFFQIAKMEIWQNGNFKKPAWNFGKWGI